MNKRSLIVLIILLLSSWLTGCNSPQEPRVFKVGLLSGSPLFDTAVDGFRDRLTELGYVEGENVVYDFQSGENDTEKMAQISEKFVEDEVDLIFTTTIAATLAAKNATEGTDIPVVFTFVIAPEKTGVVADLIRPGGNITGVRNPLDVFVGKRVEYWLEIAPEARRIWAPYDPTYPHIPVVVDVLRGNVPDLDIELVELEVSQPGDVVAELARLDEAEDVGFDAILILPDLTVQAPESWEAIKAFSQKHQLPILANTLGQVEEGALFTYLTDNVATGEQAAQLASQILQGENPATLPVETPEVSLVVSILAAEAIGVEIPQSALVQADTIIR